LEITSHFLTELTVGQLCCANSCPENAEQMTKQRRVRKDFIIVVEEVDQFLFLQ
jgi:hypothetical protein